MSDQLGSPEGEAIADDLLILFQRNPRPTFEQVRDACDGADILDAAPQPLADSSHGVVELRARTAVAQKKKNTGTEQTRKVPEKKTATRKEKKKRPRVVSRSVVREEREDGHGVVGGRLEVRAVALPQQGGRYNKGGMIMIPAACVVRPFLWSSAR